MIDFQVLGTLGLRLHDGSEARALLVRPKLVALLAYLALRQPRGWHQRNSLLAMFWPESDERHARFSLRSAVYALRSDLGQDVVQARGDEELGIDFDRLQCDALAFEDALDGQRLEEALGCYRGPLLQGLVVPGLSDFQMWLDERREGLRRRAVEAAISLAERAERDGRIDDASRWSRRAIDLSPSEESLLRRLLRLLELQGDAAAAVRTFDQWSTRLRREFDSAPSSETAAIVERMRSPVGAGVGGQAPAAASATLAPQAALVGASPFPPLAPPVALPSTEPVVDGNVTRRRRIPHLIAGVFVLIAGAAAVLSVRPTTTKAPPRSTWTVVLPFAFTGDARYAHLGDAATAILSAALGAPGPLRSVDAGLVTSFAAKRRAGTTDVNLGTEATRYLGARYFISGSVVEATGGVRVEASLYDPDDARQPGANVSATGPVDSLFAVVDQVANELLAARVGSLPARELGTKSLVALKAYVDGERELYAARYATAADAFTRAVAADSLFARAHFRLSYAASLSGHETLSRQAAQRAATLSARLQPEDRLLLSAWLAALAIQIPAAIHLYERFLVQNDRNAEAWLQLAEARYHWGPMLGISSSDAAEAFRRTLHLVPENAAALIHLARIEAREQPGGGGFDTLATEARRLGPSASEDLELRVIAAAFSGRRSEREALHAEVGARGDATRALALGAVVPVPDPAMAIELARGLTRGGAAARWRALGFAHLAQTYAARGRFRDAYGAVDSLALFLPERANELRAWMAMLPFATARREEMQRLRNEIAVLPESGSVIGPSVSHIAVHAIYPPRKRYLEAVLSILIADTARADELANGMINHRLKNWQDSAFSVDFGRAVRAELALRDKRAGAERLLSVPRTEADLTYPDVMSFGVARERYLRAEMLAADGRTPEAIAWLGTFPDPAAYDVWFLAPSLLRRAELQEKRGERPAARRSYERFIELWKNCDRELEPVLARGRTGLARVR